MQPRIPDTRLSSIGSRILKQEFESVATRIDLSRLADDHGSKENRRIDDDGPIYRGLRHGCTRDFHIRRGPEAVETRGDRAEGDAGFMLMVGERDFASRHGLTVRTSPKRKSRK
jgi:hypothetical protein